MKICDYLAEFLATNKVRHVFTVSGAGDLHILNALHKYAGITYICNHHEQASAMAAYAYACATSSLGVAMVTTGPGGTNAITGVCSAWVDSVPILMLSGQVKRADMIGSTGVRQRGIQEINIVDLVRPCTKYAAVVETPEQIRYHLERAVWLAQSGRPGPVWLDIPMDIQTSEVDPETLVGFQPPAASDDTAQPTTLPAQCQRTMELLRQAQRPILLAGYGIRAAGARADFHQIVTRLGIPVLVTWHGIDLLESSHPLYAGRFGIYGQRGANFAIQNCDLLISIGSRLSIPQTGYSYAQFARAARKVYVDIDAAELHKFPTPPDLAIQADAGQFLRTLLLECQDWKIKPDEAWPTRCRQWREKYPVALPEYTRQEGSVNSFTFVDTLSEELAENELIIPGASGTAFTCTHQALKIKKNQTCFTSNGFAEMGFDLPGAIGACIATGGKRTILITGDGSMQMNLQELQTIIHHALPIKIFYLNNQGYLTIRQTQQSLFAGTFAGSDPATGVSFPDIQKLGRVYGFSMYQCSATDQLRHTIREALACPGPVICEIVMDPRQALVPKTSFRQLPDGRLQSPPIEDLFPFLPREEFTANMLIPPPA